MWSMRRREDGSFYLTFDRYRRSTHNYPGLWEFVGKQDLNYTRVAVETNARTGYWCLPDDEGNMRVLVLEE